ncbi:MAG: hypothetical protein COA79_06105 [Planctomycetota bacterium]|nr:MAG: hypothetical protein COA79_06105 [Planctomycetota bacterium]
MKSEKYLEILYQISEIGFPSNYFLKHRMKYKTILSLTISIFLLSFNILSSQETNKALITLKKINEIMLQNYFDQTYGGIDWKKAVKETSDKISKEKDGSTAYKHIKDLLKKLKHSHLAFNPPAKYREMKKEKVILDYGSQKQLPFDYAIHDDKLLIISIDKKSDAYAQGLRLGMSISKIGKVNVEDLISKRKQYGDFMPYLNRFPNEKMSLQGIDYQSNLFHIKFNLNAYKGQLSDFGNIKGYPLSFNSKNITDDIGYVKFNIFLFAPVFKVIKAIKSFRNHKGIIIDLRNNPGGIGMLACAIAKEFCAEKYSLGTQNTTAKNDMSEMKFPVLPQQRPIKSIIVILINRSSASTSELMAMGMQENKSAIIVGEKSLGQALPSVILKLDDGSIFQYPVGDLKSFLGKTLEGNGVIPDYEVPLDPKLLATKNIDSQIQKAITIINNIK